MMTTSMSVMTLAKKVPSKFSIGGTHFSLFYVNHFMAKARKSSLKGEKNTENNKNPKRKPNGKTANEIVKRHISDKDDKITKEDFENLYIDLSLPKDKAHEPLPIKNNKERPKDAEKDNTITTPWDVISE
jgi:hypothetical protein